MAGPVRAGPGNPLFKFSFLQLQVHLLGFQRGQLLHSDRRVFRERDVAKLVFKPDQSILARPQFLVGLRQLSFDKLPCLRGALAPRFEV